MRRLETTGELRWIPAFAEPELTRMDGSRVVLAGDLLPGGFDAYAKIFHPIHEDLGCEDEELLWEEPWEDRYGRGRADQPFAARGLKWHDLALELDVEFGPGIHLSDFLEALPRGRWPRRLIGPEDGDLDVDTVHHLMRLLGPHTGEAFCLHYWPASRSHEGKDLLIEAPLDSLLSLHADPRAESSPTAFWPRGRAWLLLSHPELPFSLLACSGSLLADLLRDKPLDGIEIALTTELQHRSSRDAGS